MRRLSQSLGLPLILIGVLFPTIAFSQTRQVLIYDDFVSADGTNPTTRPPETNLSGGSWVLGGTSSLVIYGQAVRPTAPGAFDTYATIDSKSS